MDRYGTRTGKGRNRMGSSTIEYSFQYSKRHILSGLHFYLNTLFVTNNETKRVLLSMLKMVDIEWSSLTSKYFFIPKMKQKEYSF